ncbi:DNA primase [Candidatus Gracilibacteria bacterium]|nr:DNA primase [Candidatus Gracilibacteria bacterium]
MGIVEDLENAIDIVDLVGRYAKLKKAGVNYKAHCPFPGHNEKTPSFVVSPVKQIGYCFGCHKGGGPVKFIMDIENCEFKDSIEILGSLTGIQVNTNFSPEKMEAKKNMYGLYKDAAQYYAGALSQSPEMQKYVFDRGLNSEDIKTFGFGYADSGLNLYNYLKQKNYDDDIIANSNIFVNLKARKDKFINRIVFPITNLRGDVVAFTGRVTGVGEPKYLNSPASNIYDKSAILYGLYTAKNEIVNKDFIIITEGQMDTIAMQSKGFKNTVAVSGTALTEKHITIIKRLTKKIYLCFDDDKAGEKATKLALETIKNKDMEVRIITLKGGKDPDEVLQNAGIDTMQQCIDTALTPIGYFIKTSDFNIESIDEKKKLLATLLDMIKSFSDSVEQDIYLKEVASKLGLNQTIIYDKFNRMRFERVKKDDDNTHSKVAYSSQEMAIGYIINDQNNTFKITDGLLFKTGLSQDLQEIIDNNDPQSFLSSMGLEKKERYKAIAFEIEALAEKKTDDNSSGDLDKLIGSINKEVYKNNLETLKIKMNSGDDNALLEYTKMLQLAKKHSLK